MIGWKKEGKKEKERNGGGGLKDSNRNRRQILITRVVDALLNLRDRTCMTHAGP